MKAKSTLALWPDISYRQALSCRFTLDQTTYSVADCPSEVFKRFIEGCGRTPETGRRWNLAQMHNLLSKMPATSSERQRTMNPPGERYANSGEHPDPPPLLEIQT